MKLLNDEMMLSDKLVGRFEGMYDVDGEGGGWRGTEYATPGQYGRLCTSEQANDAIPPDQQRVSTHIGGVTYRTLW